MRGNGSELRWRTMAEVVRSKMTVCVCGGRWCKAVLTEKVVVAQIRRGMAVIVQIRGRLRGGGGGYTDLKLWWLLVFRWMLEVVTIC
ncbi:hypothetical protein Hanom_Chr15g01385171 [Helianthus anomalus]